MLEFLFNSDAINFLQTFSSPLMDLFFKNITHFGNPIFWLIISAMFYWVGKEKASMYLTNLMLFSAMTVEVLKIYFASPRPEIVFGSKIRVLSVEEFSTYSFPSGHATLASSVFSFYANNKNIVLTLALLLLVFLVALSRMYLGMHFLGDVIAGIILGIILGQFNKHVSSRLDKAKLQLSRFKEEFLILIAFIASIAVLAVSQNYTISA
ncbi:MAG: phosphatase PAP2 family protein [archaeon]|nr:phosphatase PAP2 family protein [archaeon]